MAGATERVVTALVLLPLFFNPDRRGRRRAIPDALYVRTAEEITRRLQEGGTLHVFRDRRPRGFWWDKGIVYRDVPALLEIDMADTAANRRWLVRYARSVLLERFRQEAIYVKFVGPVQRYVVLKEVKIHGT